MRGLLVPKTRALKWRPAYPEIQKMNFGAGRRGAGRGAGREQQEPVPISSIFGKNSRAFFAAGAYFARALLLREIRADGGESIAKRFVLVRV